MDRAFELLKDIKSVVISTDDNGIPQSRIVDIMCYDHGLYFITLRSKPFYKQLTNNNNIAITAMDNNYVQVRVVGEVVELDEKQVSRAYEENKSLIDLFPDKDSFSETASIFHVYKGKGEIFDLSGKENKMKRSRFSFGGEMVNEAGCKITNKCVACGNCINVCPFNAIKEGAIYYINPNYCDECGNCYRVCPTDAIELPKGL